MTYDDVDKLSTSSCGIAVESTSLDVRGRKYVFSMSICQLVSFARFRYNSGEAHLSR